jgi:hypothetical protein
LEDDNRSYYAFAKGNAYFEQFPCKMAGEAIPRAEKCEQVGPICPQKLAKNLTALEPRPP